MSVAQTYASNDGNWLRCTDLDGKTHKVTIEKVETVEVKDDEKGHIPKICVSFQGKEKGLLLNKTNAKTLAAGLGDNEMEWHGSTIIMFPTTCEFQGSTVPCIRVRLDEVMADDNVPF
jgi:hypothetical protein